MRVVCREVESSRFESILRLQFADLHFLLVYHHVHCFAKVFTPWCFSCFVKLQQLKWILGALEPFDLYNMHATLKVQNIYIVPQKIKRKKQNAGMHRAKKYFVEPSLPAILTSVPVPAHDKHPYSRMQIPPCFTVGCCSQVMGIVGFVPHMTFPRMTK